MEKSDDLQVGLCPGTTAFPPLESVFSLRSEFCICGHLQE